MLKNRPTLTRLIVLSSLLGLTTACSGFTDQSHNLAGVHINAALVDGLYPDTRGRSAFNDQVLDPQQCCHLVSSSEMPRPD